MIFQNSFQKEKQARIAIITILFLFIFFLGTYLASNTPPTSDEFTFVASGYSYWKTADFRMNTEQPPLIKLFNTLPLLAMNLNLPTNHISWQKAQLFREDGFYKQFVFHANSDKKEDMLFFSRLFNIFLALALGAVILKFATELFGPWAGVLALAIYSLEPTRIAYTSLFMMDIGFSLFATLSFYTLWKFLNKPTIINWSYAAIFFGLAQLTKHTAIMLFGIYPAILIAHLIAGSVKTPKKFRNKITFLFTSYFGIALVGILFINAIYGFQGTFQTTQQMFDYDINIDKTVYQKEKLFENKYTKFISQIPQILPYPYVKGIGYVLTEAKSQRTTYLFGKTSEKGFWNYYLLSFLAKTPITILILLAAATTYFASSKKNWNNEIILILPAIIYVILFSINQKQIGIRHLLQVYPLMIIFISRVANSKWCKKTAGKIIITILLLFTLIELAIAFPDYISYANQIIGINNTHKYFADSNIDMSQNIDKAINFIKANPQTKAAISTTDTLNEYVDFKRPQNCEIGQIIADSYAINANKEYAWLKCKKPIQRLGRTLFVYNITKC